MPGKQYSMVVARVAGGTPCHAAGMQDVLTVAGSKQAYPLFIISFTHG